MEREMEEAQRELAERRVVSERRQTSHKIAQPGYTKSVRSSMRSFGLWICEGFVLSSRTKFAASHYDFFKLNLLSNTFYFLLQY